ALQEPRIIRQTVEDLRRCQREAVDLAQEGAVHCSLSPLCRFWVFSKDLLPKASRATESRPGFLQIKSAPWQQAKPIASGFGTHALKVLMCPSTWLPRGARAF